jgi:hypothetical protein
MMDNHSIQAVHRTIIICFTHKLGQIQVLWKLDILADLAINTRLFKEEGFALNINTMMLYKFVANLHRTYQPRLTKKIFLIAHGTLE